MYKTQLLLLELDKCILVSLSGIQRITIDFVNRFHWILGTNGAGKSSVIKEATPLAADFNHYQEGGYKYSVWKVNEKVYHLKSTLHRKKSTHSFCVEEPDGSKRELNPGLTSTIYASLVEEIFGITQESHRVAIGKLNLTEMPTSVRKSVLTTLSSVDYSYALAYFKKLSSLHRSLRGSIEIDQERLVVLKSSNINVLEMQEHTEEIKKLKLKIEGLMDLRPNVSEPEYVVKQNVQKTLVEIQTLYDRAKQFSLRNTLNYPLEPEEELRKKISDLEAKHQHREATVDALYREFDETSRKMTQYSSQSGLSKEELHKTICELNESLGYAYIYVKGQTDATAALMAFNEVFGGIQNLSEIMTVEKEEFLNSRASWLKGIEALNKERQTLMTRHTQCSAEALGMRSHQHDDNITCPKCEFSFNPLFNQAKLQQLDKIVQESAARMREIDEELGKLQDYEARYQAWSAGQDAYYRFISKNSLFSDFWSYVNTQRLHLEAPSNISRHLTFFKRELHIKVKEEQTLKEIEELNKKLAWMNKVNELEIQNLASSLKSLEEQLTKLYAARTETLDTLRSLKGKAALATFVRETASQAESLKTKLEGWIRKDYDHTVRSSISDLIRGIDSEIRDREERLRVMTTKSAEIARLEKAISDTEARASAIKDAMSVLSPKEGLIAKGLTGFINHFTSLMNGIIDRIMTYPMVIPPIEPDNDDFELDFALPIIINGNRSSDISECSKGQAEIINLAWRILYLKFKKLDWGLLPLDEFGSNLDFVHRQRAFEAVKQLLTITNFSQVLMVSHLSNTFGLLDGAGISVLCPSNIELPADVTFNQTTKIVRV